MLESAPSSFCIVQPECSQLQLFGHAATSRVRTMVCCVIIERCDLIYDSFTPGAIPSLALLVSVN